MSLDWSIIGAAKLSECECPSCGNSHKRQETPTLASHNITHNLSGMFREAGVYEILWHGDGLRAGDILPKLKECLVLMRSDEARFRRFDAANGWGIYPNALAFLERVIQSCEQYPDGILACYR